MGIDMIFKIAILAIVTYIGIIYSIHLTIKLITTRTKGKEFVDLEQELIKFVDQYDHYASSSEKLNSIHRYLDKREYILKGGKEY